MDSLTFNGYTFSLCQDDTPAGQHVCINPPLTGKELNPLELSIAKWKFIVEALGAGERISGCGGKDTCALCVAYWECHNCIIVVRGGGEPGCGNTPFDEWCRDTSLENAKAELEFLEGLRGG